MVGYRLKKALVRWTPFKRCIDPGSGQLDRSLLSDLMVNFVFQRFFRVNAHVPWSVKFTSRVTNPDKIHLGKDVWRSFAVSGNCYIQAGNGIIIGDGSMWGPGVGIISTNHDVHCLKKRTKGGPVTIGKNCWIGMNSVILPDVTLGDNVVVGAGSVVTKNFPDNVIIAGAPARIIREK